MHQWIETHGFESLLIAGLFSLIMSAAPIPPTTWGFWKMWAFNAAKAAGANASHFMNKKDPAFEELAHAETLNNDGSKTIVDTQASSSPKT